MMEAICTSVTSVNNHFTRQYIPEDNSEHHTRRRDNLKSHVSVNVFGGFCLWYGIKKESGKRLRDVLIAPSTQQRYFFVLIFFFFFCMVSAQNLNVQKGARSQKIGWVPLIENQ
jgi:hypothetical protein